MACVLLLAWVATHSSNQWHVHSFDEPWLQSQDLPNQRTPGQQRAAAAKAVKVDVPPLVYRTDIPQALQLVWLKYYDQLIMEQQHPTRNGDRLYHHISTGNYWWEAEDALQADFRQRGLPRPTLIPLIIFSDKTLAGSKLSSSVYPVSLTIGNLPNAIQNIWCIPITLPYCISLAVLLLGMASSLWPTSQPYDTHPSFPSLRKNVGDTANELSSRSASKSSLAGSTYRKTKVWGRSDFGA